MGESGAKSAFGSARALRQRMADDVTGADLRRADPTDLYLTGVRWDPAARLARAWRTRVAAASQPRPDGAFEIRTRPA
jgi:hypothetical protein